MLNRKKFEVLGLLALLSFILSAFVFTAGKRSGDPVLMLSACIIQGVTLLLGLAACMQGFRDEREEQIAILERIGT